LNTVPTPGQFFLWLRANPARSALAGVLGAVLLGWLGTGAAPYFPANLGSGSTPAFAEFTPLAVQLREMAQPSDSLFVLPETDSTPQLHAMTGLLPPNTWVKGWAWYFEAPNIVNILLAEWENNPPTYVVVFPDLLIVGQPGIQPLIDFTVTHYRSVATVPAVVFHGDAIIYARRAD
jgi:hypothetical protein